MRKQDMIEYLQENCICAPDSNYMRSQCGVPCRAEWHWWLEADRMRIIVNLRLKFDPPRIKGVNS
jgi:hypothetical protein